MKRKRPGNRFLSFGFLSSHGDVEIIFDRGWTPAAAPKGDLEVVTNLTGRRKVLLLV